MLVEKIKEAYKQDRLKFRLHAEKRMFERGIFHDEIIEVLNHGNIIEEYPDASPFPACLIRGMVRKDQPLYLVCSYDEQEKIAYIITVHWFDPEKWIDPLTRRRKRK